MCRPTKFTDEELDSFADDLLQWMKDDDNIFFKYFAIDKGCHPEEISHWSARSAKFHQALYIAKAIQEKKLIMGSLRGKLKEGSSIWMLCTNHDFVHPTKMAQASVVVMNEDEFVERFMNKKRGLDVKQDE